MNRARPRQQVAVYLPRRFYKAGVSFFVCSLLGRRDAARKRQQEKVLQGMRMQRLELTILADFGLQVAGEPK